MNKWLKNHGKLAKPKRDINAQNAKTKPIIYNSIQIVYVLDGMLLFVFILFYSKIRKYCGKMTGKKQKTLVRN